MNALRLAICLAAASCLSFELVSAWVSPPYSSAESNCRHRNRVPNQGRLFLFDSLLQKGSKSSRGQRSGSTLNRIPQGVLDYLGSGFGLEPSSPSSASGNNGERVDGMPDLVNELMDQQISASPNAPPFPYSIDLQATPNGNAKRQPSRLIIRHLEEDDIKKILPEVVREFGALAPSQPESEFEAKLENFLFSLTVLIGLTQRVVRRQKGYDGTAARPDHNVICLVEQTHNDGAVSSNGDKDASYTEQIVGIAELSWQPPNPNGNAPPFVLPYFAKELISRFGPSRDGTAPKTPAGYISNVLVWKTRRGRGYSRLLMAALEGIGRRWGCDDVRLHVDANEYSGRIARGLYWSLGYEGVPDRGNSKDKFDWMGPAMANQGLYLVDGVPLLYLRKSLKEE